MIEDVQVPYQVPAKRKQLEAALDLWLATWLARDDLTPSERRRVTEEKERRKALRAREERAVGLLVDPAGATPPQLEALRDLLAASSATAFHHPGTTSPIHQACKRNGTPITIHERDMRAVVKASDVVIALPRESSPANSAVWDMLKYARHRKVVSWVVWPDGQILEGGEANA